MNSLALVNNPNMVSLALNDDDEGGGEPERRGAREEGRGDTMRRPPRR